MKSTKRCCFCGHNSIWDNDVKDCIKCVAKNLIINHDVTEFWVGNYGDFDHCAAFAIRDLKKTYANIELDLIIPYITSSIDKEKELYYKNYDNLLIADIPTNTPKKFHIIKSNEYMVNNSDYMICYIQRTCGGAIKTYEYAKRKKLVIFNVAKNLL